MDLHTDLKSDMYDPMPIMKLVLSILYNRGWPQSLCHRHGYHQLHSHHNCWLMVTGTKPIIEPQNICKMTSVFFLY